MSDRRPYTAKIGMDALVERADGSTINFGDAIYHPENAREAEAYALPVPTPAETGLREALERLVEDAAAYSPREDHDWRCYYRTTKVGGWKVGDPPVIRCECGRVELDAALEAARTALSKEERL